MILVVTPNPAIDITYTVERLEPGRVHRPTAAAQRPGGKGINVARILHALGSRVVVTGLFAGAAGGTVVAALDAYGLGHRVTRMAGDTRRTVTVIDQESGAATGFHEPGPASTAGDWAQLLGDVVDLLDTADVLVCSGSLPPDSPDDALVPFVDAARRAGVPTIVDTGAGPLRFAAAAGASLVKPNREELLGATGITDPVQAAQALRETGVNAVVASLGAEGLVATADGGTVRVHPGQVVHGNPTGAGDAVVAALAAGLETGRGWRETLRHAAALGSAAVQSPVAGEFPHSAYERLLPLTHVTEV